MDGRRKGCCLGTDLPGKGKQPTPLTGAFRKAAKILPHRSEAAIGMLYYNVLRKEREEPEAKPAAQPEFKVDKRLLEAFQGLPEYMHELHKR